MNKKRMAGIVSVLAVCLFLAAAGKELSTESQCEIRDAEGNVSARASYHQDGWKLDCESGQEAYVQIACEEAAAQLAKEEGIPKEAAARRLAKEKMQIHTYFRQEIFEGIRKVYEQSGAVERSDFAAAVSDAEGNLLAGYSGSLRDEKKNYLLEKTEPASTIKPLSVYMPALEDGTICWSSKYMDSAYMQLEEGGEKRDWPMNLEPYTNVSQTVKTALQKSLNTIAVKILKEYGVKRSCDFLMEQFSMDLEQELHLMQTGGEDEILGNIAMGYLRGGVTVLDMLGYYQVFVDGGTYRRTEAVKKICKSDGETVVEVEREEKRVCSGETAYIMNRLLHEVIDANGTGADAQIEGMDLCGKSGTGNDNCWFIGISPEYVCAVWYRRQDGIEDKNYAAEIFGDLICAFPRDGKAAYPVSENVEKRAYCELTGLLANASCKYVNTGYYRKDHLPKKCDCE